MEKIEVGEYVRTTSGEIFKIKAENYFGIITKYENKEDKIEQGKNWYATNGREINKEDITKHSKNIIDLIEVGDIVNKHKVLNVNLDGNKCIDIDTEKPSYESYLFEEQIDTILTYEQYENNCYRLEE